MAVTPADAAGQLLLIELEESAWSASLERWLRSHCPGGVLFSQVRSLSAGACGELLAHIVSVLDFVPFLVLEEDGGATSLLRALLPPLPSPRAVAQIGVRAANRLGDLVGTGMKLLGFNTNLAPTLDLLTPVTEATLGPRAFSADAHEVTRCGEAFARGLASHGVLACAKHFPGLGGAQLEAGSSLPVVGKTMAELWREDLLPYRELIGKVPLVMLSPCAYKAYDFDVLRPAVMSSRVAQGLLRVKLGYHGSAVADFRRLRSSGLTADLGEVAAQSVIAGCDVLVTSAEAAATVVAGLRRAIELGRLSASDLGRSLERLRRARKGLARPSGRVSKAAVDHLARRYESFGKGYQGEEQKI